MKTHQHLYSFDNKGNTTGEEFPAFEPDLILFFGNRNFLEKNEIIKRWREKYPAAIITGCSTSGEIYRSAVYDEVISATAVKFEKTKLEYRSVRINEAGGSYQAGNELINLFDKEKLRHVFLLSEGLNVNGSELVAGVRAGLPEGCNATGGLAGDGDKFEKTLVVDNSGEALSNEIAAVGFYGDAIRVGYGSMGGWDIFGIERSVTKSKNNVLYEIDNQPALDLYKSFLGDKAAELPASGLLFPLSMRVESSKEPLVRTILAINEEDKSLTFAGDIPEGAQVKLMKANIDRLIDGAENAAKTSVAPLNNKKAALAILISCVGRKLVLKQLVEEEVESVRAIVGDDSTITGFYSYGEIAPFLAGAQCELHNQTMTITTFTEEI